MFLLNMCILHIHYLLFDMSFLPLILIYSDTDLLYFTGTYNKVSSMNRKYWTPGCMWQNLQGMNYTHTHTHTDTQTLTHRHTPTQTHTHVRAHTHACAYTHHPFILVSVHWKQKSWNQHFLWPHMYIFIKCVVIDFYICGMQVQNLPSKPSHWKRRKYQ